MIFKDVYETFVKFEKNWNDDINKINNYINSLIKDDTIINKVENLINKEYNTDYDPNSADYFTLKLYINISLYVSLKNIKQKQSENVEENMYYFLSSYIALIKFLKSKEIDSTYHQKN